MRSLRKAAVASTIFALAGTLAACEASGSSSGGAQGGQANVPIRVIWQPSGMTSYFYANSKDLWKKYGLTLKPIKMDTGQEEISALVGGSADIAFMGGPPTVTALGRNAGVRIIFSTNDASKLEGLYANPKSGINSLQDLVGKRVAVPTGSSADAGMHLVLQKAHINPDSIHLINMDPAQMLPAYQRGNIDAVWVWDTWGERMLGAGAKRITTESQSGVAEPNSWVVTNSFLKAHPGEVARFVAALNEGARGANSTPSVVAHEYAQVTGITPAQATDIMSAEHTLTISDLEKTSSPLSFTSSKGGFAHTLAVTAQMLKTLGVLPQAPTETTIRNHIDTSVLKQAQQVK